MSVYRLLLAYLAVLSVLVSSTLGKNPEESDQPATIIKKQQNTNVLKTLETKLLNELDNAKTELKQQCSQLVTDTLNQINDQNTQIDQQITKQIKSMNLIDENGLNSLLSKSMAAQSGQIKREMEAELQKSREIADGTSKQNEELIQQSIQSILEREMKGQYMDQLKQELQSSVKSEMGAVSSNVESSLKGVLSGKIDELINQQQSTLTDQIKREMSDLETKMNAVISDHTNQQTSRGVSNVESIQAELNTLAQQLNSLKETLEVKIESDMDKDQQMTEKYQNIEENYVAKSTYLSLKYEMTLLKSQMVKKDEKLNNVYKVIDFCNNFEKDYYEPLMEDYIQPMLDMIYDVFSVYKNGFEIICFNILKLDQVYEKNKVLLMSVFYGKTVECMEESLLKYDEIVLEEARRKINQYSENEIDDEDKEIDDDDEDDDDKKDSKPFDANEEWSKLVNTCVNESRIDVIRDNLPDTTTLNNLISSVMNGSLFGLNSNNDDDNNDDYTGRKSWFQYMINELYYSIWMEAVMDGWKFHAKPKGFQDLVYYGNWMKHSVSNWIVMAGKSEIYTEYQRMFNSLILAPILELLEVGNDQITDADRLLFGDLVLIVSVCIILIVGIQLSKVMIGLFCDCICPRITITSKTGANNSSIRAIKNPGNDGVSLQSQQDQTEIVPTSELGLTENENSKSNKVGDTNAKKANRGKKKKSNKQR